MARLLEEFEAWQEYVCAAGRRNSTLKLRLQEAEWRLSASQAIESQLREERATVHGVVHSLQKSLHCFKDVKDENDALKQRVRHKELHLVELQTRHDEELRRLDTERLAEQENHSLLLAAVQQEAECRVAEEAGRLQEVVGRRRQEVETLARRLGDVEKQQRAELFALQVENDIKIAKLQRAALLGKQGGSGASDHDIFREKLRHLRESKEQEIAALQRQLAQLEQRQRTQRDSLTKRRRL